MGSSTPPRLALDTLAPAPGRAQTLRFRIRDEPTGTPVRDFDLEHTKRMHLILARRDLTGFQHLRFADSGGHLVALPEGDLAFLHVHPTAAPGTDVEFIATFPTEGRYRLFLQFQHHRRGQAVAFTQEVTR